MESKDRQKIKDLYFELKEIIDSIPGVNDEIRAALRFYKVSNSSAIETNYIDPIFLRTALYNGGDNGKHLVSPVYRKAFLEAQAHDRMLRSMEKEAADKAELSVSLLLSWHRTLFEQSWPDIAGKFRDIDVRIRGSSHRPPHPSKVGELVYQHLAWLDGLMKLLGPVTPASFFEILHVSADAHFRLSWTYPFQDGNGRIARAVSNYMLLYAGMPYNTIPFEHRDEYFKAIEKSTLSDFSPLEKFLFECYAKTLEKISGFVYLVKQTAGQA